jgi:NADH-quinone oxidoreductase subunit A
VAQYLPVVALLVLAVVFAALSVLVSKLLAPRRPTVAKSAPYECGIVPRREPPDRFPVRFYLVAMIFIIFDIEIVFLYPWAVIYRELGPFGLWEIVVFAVVVFASFLYLISHGALDWGPVQRARRAVDQAMVSASRTASSTVRRVGSEGRGERRTVEPAEAPVAPAAHDEPAQVPEEVPA